MKIVDLILWILMLVTFASTLRAALSESLIKRRKFRFIALLSVAAMFAALLLLRPPEFDFPFELEFILCFGWVLPELIGRSLNLRRWKDQAWLLEFPINRPSRLKNTPMIVFATVFPFLLIVLFGGFSLHTGPDGRTVIIYDWTRLDNDLIFLGICALGAVLCWMEYTQTVKVSDRGFTLNQLAWEWSDLRSYSWRNGRRRAGFHQIHLEAVWSPWEIDMEIPAEVVMPLDRLLTQKLEGDNQPDKSQLTKAV